MNMADRIQYLRKAKGMSQGPNSSTNLLKPSHMFNPSFHLAAAASPPPEECSTTGLRMF